MPPVSITARFPLGVYHGHASDGSPDPLPSPARLLSALVSTAQTGTSALKDGRMSDRVAMALTWMEEHPPNGLHVPDTLPVSLATDDRIAYRDMGTIEKSRPKTAGKNISDGYAINGAVGWVWKDMPDEVRAALAQLCEDVPCLGEMDSPVVMSTEEIESNWYLDADATAFTPGGMRLQIPGPGKLRTLKEMHEQSHPSKTPSAASDRFRPSGDTVRVFPVFEECLRTARYFSVKDSGQRDEGGAPWRDALILLADDGTGRELAPERRLSWCVAFHRALVARIGDGAPPVVTGRYPDGIPVPANRVAIQYVPSSVLLQSVVQGAFDTPGAFLIMLPKGASDEEREVILQALEGMTQLRSRWAEARLRPPDEVFDARMFWRPPAPGTKRLWSPTPVAVPEVTRQRGEWSFEDAILLSLGFVWREALQPAPRGTQGYRLLVAHARDYGAGVMWHHRVAKNPGSYVHKMPESVVAQPYTALMDTGGLMTDTEVVAVGQSRHLGGGLLVPADIPSELASNSIRRHS